MKTLSKNAIIGYPAGIITGITFSDEKEVVSIKFGNLKVTLTDKIK